MNIYVVIDSEDVHGRPVAAFDDLDTASEFIDLVEEEDEGSVDFIDWHRVTMYGDDATQAFSDYMDSRD